MQVSSKFNKILDKLRGKNVFLSHGRVEKADKLDFVEFVPFIFLVLFSNENAHQHIRKYLLKVKKRILFYFNLL
jgi:hypothetical protein